MNIYVNKNTKPEDERMIINVYTTDNKFNSVGIECGFNDKSINKMVAMKIAATVSSNTIPNNKDIIMKDENTHEQIIVNGNKIKRLEIVYDDEVLASVDREGE